MEKSISSSPSKTIDAQEDDLPAESGWTEYLEEFSAYNRGEREDQEYYDDIIEQENQHNNCNISASMVSDAGSGPEWKHKILTPGGKWTSLGGLPNMPKKLSFNKKKRTQEISSYDDSLEDTASSPINSPKIAMGFRRMDINSRRADEIQDNSYTGQVIAIDEPTEDKVMHKGKEFNNNNLLPDATGFIDLKKKGLCLVPTSMVMNFVE